MPPFTALAPAPYPYKGHLINAVITGTAAEKPMWTFLFDTHEFPGIINATADQTPEGVTGFLESWADAVMASL